MIATLSGKVTEKLPSMIVVGVNGVGYGVLVPLETYANLNIDDDTKLYIHEHIKENMHELYGFSEIDTKNLFEQLIDVNGVGPKVGLNILSIGNVTEVRQAIASGDIKMIQSAPGVGRKVAERILIELKDKVGLLSSLDAQSLLTGDTSAQQDEAVQALVALGFSVPDALIALKPVDKDLSTEERIRLALKA